MLKEKKKSKKCFNEAKKMISVITKIENIH